MDGVIKMDKKINDKKNMGEIIAKMEKYYKQVIVDNEFEYAYNMPFDAFEEYTREDIIEAFFIYMAIKNEK